MSEYIDFRQISSQISFKQLLDNLNIPYAEKGKELRGEYKDLKFIIDTNKNLFFCPADDKEKGSVINFLAMVTGSDVRTAALDLHKRFIFKGYEPQRELPELKLHYCEFLENWRISKEIAETYGVGLVKQRSIVSGKIAFKMLDPEGNLTGYFSFNHKEKEAGKNKWFFPRNFKRTLWNAAAVKDFKSLVVVCNPFEALCLIQKGLLNTVCLIGKSMTESQEESLKQFKSILLLHAEPDNVLLRLKSKCFVKAPTLIQPVKDYSVDLVNDLLEFN
ncbi:MAG: hypothetical protein NT007_08120 [Candidatus Kapabacteria bacterium]|nr:hypothetical protein [Candidatus Kapabacteria bacterium]